MTDTGVDRVEVTCEQGLWHWLGSHHPGPSVWLVTWKAAHSDKHFGRDEAIDALIAHGWVDGRRKRLEDDRSMQLIAPRQQQS